MSETLAYQLKEIKTIEDLKNDPMWKKLKEQKRNEKVYNPKKDEWKNVKGISLKNGYPEFISFFLRSFSEYSTEEIQRQRDILVDVLQRDDIPLSLKAEAGIYVQPTENELLYRKDPSFKSLRDKWVEVEKKHDQDYMDWYQRTLETEGKEKLSDYVLQHRAPDFHSPEELDLNIKYVRAQVDAGIAPQSELEEAIRVKELGGFEKYRRERNKEVLLAERSRLETMGDNVSKKGAENITRTLQEEGLLEE